MSDVVVGAALRASRPDAARGLSAFHGLDLGLLIDAQHHRAIGWVLVESDNVVDLGGQVGVGGGLDGPNPPGLDAVLAPAAGDGVAADTEFAGQQPGRPVGDPQPGGWWVEGGRQDLGPAEPTDRLWSSRSGSVGEPSSPRRTYRRRQAITVGWETPTRWAIWVLAAPSAARSRMRARWMRTAGSWADRAKRCSSARSSGVINSAAAAGLGHGRPATNGDLTHPPHRCRGWLPQTAPVQHAATEGRAAVPAAALPFAARVAQLVASPTKGPPRTG
jgi:hypothetical protein